MGGKDAGITPTEGPSLAAAQQPREDIQFDWAALVALTVHPVKVAIIEALLSVGHPLSVPELSKLLADSHYSANAIAYHAGGLAKLGALEVADFRRKRGAYELYYFFPARR